MIKTLEKFDIILASQSPRRKNLLRGIDVDFRIVLKDEIDESYPSHLNKSEIPEYLAKKKAQNYIHDLKPESLLITADTVVWLDNKVLGKPESEEDAVSILNELSGRMHEVITGVCITSVNKQSSFCSLTKVWFRKLNAEEISYYINQYKPYDKAGAYGIQEWIGYVGIERIEGSYFNVMGLPIQQLYNELLNFTQNHD